MTYVGRPVDVTKQGEGVAKASSELAGSRHTSRGVCNNLSPLSLPSLPFYPPLPRVQVVLYGRGRAGEAEWKSPRIDHAICIRSICRAPGDSTIAHAIWRFADSGVHPLLLRLLLLFFVCFLFVLFGGF